MVLKPLETSNVKGSMKYIVTRFDGYYFNYWIIEEGRLDEYNDGSFDDDKDYPENKKYKFYELGAQLEKLPFSTKNKHSPKQ